MRRNQGHPLSNHPSQSLHSFVTGATGFVGSHLVDRLLARGDVVSCLVRKTSNLQWLKDKPVHLVYGDLARGVSPEIETALKSADYVFHVAGTISGIQREDYFKTNAEGTRNLLEAMVQANSAPKRFVLVSSIAAGGPGFGADPIKEEQTPRPACWYGESKLEGEKITREYEQRFPITILRPPPVYGPRDYQLLNVFRLLKIGIIPVLGNRVKTNFVYITDLVNGIMLAAEKKGAIGEVFNIGDRDNLASGEILKRIVFSTGKKAIPVYIPMVILQIAAFFGTVFSKLTRTSVVLNLEKFREINHPNWMIHISKAAQILGYQPEISLEQGGRLTFQWYQEQGLL